MSWKTADTAPRDGTVIIGRFAQKDGQALADQAVTAAVPCERVRAGVTAGQKGEGAGMNCELFTMIMLVLIVALFFCPDGRQ